MSLYKPEDSPFWYINISRPGFRRVRESTGATDRQEAQRIHDERKAELWKLKAPLRGRTWGAAVKLWISRQSRSDSELYSLRKFAKHFRDRYIEEVDASAVDEALSAFCETAGTYMRYRTMVRAILGVAKDEGWITEVPKLRTRKDRKPSARMWLTPEQWDKLYLCLPAHQRPMADFGLQTGLRQSNVLGLTWDRVDIERRVVWVEAEDMKGSEAVAVPLNDRAVSILEACLLAGRHETHVFVFRGKPITEIKTGFMAACVKAGVGRYVTDDKGRVRYEGFTWHGLRHTFATWHTQNGTPDAVLQKLGAWKDPRMVKNYAHHSPGFLAQFANNNLKK